jgi:hypothetical protein
MMRPLIFFVCFLHACSILSVEAASPTPVFSATLRPGHYTGIIGRHAEVNSNMGGRLDYSVTRSGLASGSLWMDGRRYPFRVTLPRDSTAHWHLNYETVACYDGVTSQGSVGLRARSTPASPSSGSSASNAPTTRSGLGGPRSITAEDYRVTKMKFAKTRDPATNKNVNDKTTVIYNDYVTIRDIPLEAYDYVVNGKPALEWVMERQSVTTDKDSGIINDANLWATETMDNPKYPLELFLRVITVSLETMKIVKGLPGLNI